MVKTNKPSVKLTSAQKEAALPFVQPTKKSKSLKQFFKKITSKSLSTAETQKTQYKLTFIPITKNNETVSESTEIVLYDIETSSTTTTDITEPAQRIWDQDTTVCSSLDKVVEWIGNGKESSNSILQSYMSLFDFKDLKLEQAFRNLCSKLYLKGETQQIDRVLLQFSARYFECNPKCIFGAVDVVHAIVYSLLLLNTDLHVAQGDYKKMTQSAFIKNTMSAISSGTPAYICSSPSSQSFDWTPLQRIPSSTSEISNESSSYTRSVDSTIPRNLSSLSIGSKTWEMELKQVLKQMYSSIRHCQITNPSSPPTSIHTNSSRVSAFKRSVGSIIKKKAVSDNEDSVTIKSVRSSVSSSMQTTNAPYYKEGSVIRKHLLAAKDQKASHREWKQCFMVIERSQITMYKTCSTSDAQIIESIDLKHSLATALPSGYSSQRQHAFTIEQSNGSVHVFQTVSAQQVEEWVSICNYWAARESKEPLVGGISSMEYGWGQCLENMSSTMIHEWQSPASPYISSVLEESAQYEVLRNYVYELTTQLDQHRDIKSKMISHFTGSKSYAKAMNNWENKSHYLLREIIKYQNYCNSIEKSLSL
ncbi:hypothetical protein INT47_006310 [Mucor saturninus]|uniref:Uncharacterized protein n=1 Tax=Mucor saturninus TaxID=64648 RepID=A0A8H7V5S8_9FUNG|nr:hypothetical protein INT47_006310 [Mucor saturninus]